MNHTSLIKIIQYESFKYYHNLYTYILKICELKKNKYTVVQYMTNSKCVVQIHSSSSFASFYFKFRNNSKVQLKGALMNHPMCTFTDVYTHIINNIDEKRREREKESKRRESARSYFQWYVLNKSSRERYNRNESISAIVRIDICAVMHADDGSVVRSDILSDHT